MPRVIEPRNVHGTPYQHFVCPECGNVWKLPADPDEPGPWCAHGDPSTYRWVRPTRSTLGWARAVRARVSLAKDD